MLRNRLGERLILYVKKISTYAETRVRWENAVENILIRIKRKAKKI